jgi:carboxyl-terminal processing protease
MFVGQWAHDSSAPNPEAEEFETLRSAYEVIRESYVEPVPGDSLTASSLEGMMETLDPFSAYISPERMSQVQETFEGSFEGIGVSYELIDGPRGQDTIAVLSVVSGGPSAEAGLRAGDRIVAVEGEEAVGWSHPKIQRRLKGPQGSDVTVTLRRPGHSERLRRTITRDTVPLETVEAAYMIDDQTGYVRLSRFARTTHDELVESLQTLEEEGMDRFVLDLRGNAGGLMTMAEEVADEFLVEGQLIVTARSRHDEYEGARYATEEGHLQDAPMIVLVDEHSASASEIVAGALQDHDRALLLGQHTFGKGLVQRQFDLRDGSGLRLTVARFHTPSGRMLQRPSERRRDSVVTILNGASGGPNETVPDSLVHRTDAGRRVVGGGGIRPDRLVSDTLRNPFFQEVEAQGLIRDFSRRWTDAHTDSLRKQWGNRPESFAKGFQLSSSVYPAFIRYAAERGVRAPDSVEVTDPDSGSLVRERIETRIKSYVGQRLFGTSMLIRVRNTEDPVVREALRSWSTAEEWARRYPVK